MTTHRDVAQDWLADAEDGETPVAHRQVYALIAIAHALLAAPLRPDYSLTSDYCHSEEDE